MYEPRHGSGAYNRKITMYNKDNPIKLGIRLPPPFIYRVVTVNGAEHVDLDFRKPETEEEADIVRTNALGVPMRMPLEVKADGGDWWLLPIEPIISVVGKNIVVKRNVSKGRTRGSIKEKWSQDDYQITIEGILINYDKDAYPEEDVKRLRSLCEGARLKVRCKLFELFSIDYIVVENFEFPMTSGIQNQGYRISAVSDDVYKLLLKRSDLT